MGLSFRKSIQILPGVKLNISSGGIGISAGVTGLHASINSKGQIRGTASLPGTGIRYTKSTNVKKIVPAITGKAEEKKAEKTAAKKTSGTSTKSSASKASSAKSSSTKASGAKTSTAKTKKTAPVATEQVLEEQVLEEQLAEDQVAAVNEAETEQTVEAQTAKQAATVDEAQAEQARAVAADETSEGKAALSNDNAVATKKAPAKAKGGKTSAASAKKQLAQTIVDIYAIPDKNIDWLVIKNSSANIGYENWNYLKNRAAKVLDGDIDTYLEIINDINPFAELIELGSQFSCGTDSPMKMAVECIVNSEKVLGEYKDDKELLEDYVAGTAIKTARDLFAILPLWQVEITCVENEKTVLNAKFVRDSFESLNFDKIDASDTVKKLGGIIAV